MLTTLLALAGFGVDFWHWNRTGARMQKAADAAALGGAVFMPENIGGVAFTTALDITRKNGFEHGAGDTTVSVTPGLRPNQLKVKITKVVHNFFGSMVGASNTTIVKSAIGEYERPVNMGSPVNQFGNDPQSGAAHGSTRYPDFWANVFGPRSQKSKGDAVLGKVCPSGTDNCPGGVSADHSPLGYFYGIEVLSGATSPLAVQVFDPAFAHVGDNCGNNNDPDGGGSLAPSNLLGASQLAPNFNASFPVANPSVRYAPASNSLYCTGDQYYNGTGEGGAAPWTVYHVRAPDDTPSDPTNNPVVCSVEFPGYAGNLRTALTATTPQSGAPGLFVSYFRQWYQLCSINNPKIGTYFLQVQTVTKVNGSAAPDSSGANRFSIRAGIAGNFTTNYARVYGDVRTGIYANSPAANTTFYLARVLPGAKGRSLVMSFFDTGDAAAAGTLRVLPPPDSNVGASFSGCTYTPPPGNSTGPPWGTFQATQSNCSISGVSSATYNGQWVQFKIPIPDNYNCNYSSADGCWTRINFAFPSAVQDTTTWMAQIEGDPVRLVL